MNKNYYQLKDYHAQYGELTEGTCEMCFHTSRFVDQTYVFIQQEHTTHQEEYHIDLRVEQHDADNLLIDNIMSFALWLKQRKLPEIPHGEQKKTTWLKTLIKKYNHRLDGAYDFDY